MTQTAAAGPQFSTYRDRLTALANGAATVCLQCLAKAQRVHAQPASPIVVLGAPHKDWLSAKVKCACGASWEVLDGRKN
jgi:hypothetical protein